jgi:hypothetical protein
MAGRVALEVGLGLDDAAQGPAFIEIAYQQLSQKKARERNRTLRYR